jgi:coenzyme PQQ precursor peptide PqqA
VFTFSRVGIPVSEEYTPGACGTAAADLFYLYLNKEPKGGRHMAWTTPTLVEICIGLEINGYLPAEF